MSLSWQDQRKWKYCSMGKISKGFCFQPSEEGGHCISHRKAYMCNRSKLWEEGQYSHSNKNPGGGLVGKHSQITVRIQTVMLRMDQMVWEKPEGGRDGRDVSQPRPGDREKQIILKVGEVYSQWILANWWRLADILDKLKPEREPFVFSLFFLCLHADLAYTGFAMVCGW